MTSISRAYLKVVELFISCAPNRVHQVVVLPDETKGLVGGVTDIPGTSSDRRNFVIAEPTVLALRYGTTPKFHVDMLARFRVRQLFCGQRNRKPIEVVTLSASQLEDGRGEVGMRADDPSNVTGRHSGSTYDQRNVNVSLKRALLARRKSPLADMVTLTRWIRLGGSL